MDTATKKLKKSVDERKRIIVEVVRLIENFILNGVGKVVQYEQHSCHTHVVYEFRDFAGFDVMYSTGETMFGGTSVDLYWNSLPVFRIRYQSEPKKDCEVYAFSKRPWLAAFRSAMRKKKKILQQKEEQKVKAELAHKRVAKKEMKRRALLKEAERLGLVKQKTA